MDKEMLHDTYYSLKIATGDRMMFLSGHFVKEVYQKKFLVSGLIGEGFVVFWDLKDVYILNKDKIICARKGR